MTASVTWWKSATPSWGASLLAAASLAGVVLAAGCNPEPPLASPQPLAPATPAGQASDTPAPAPAGAGLTPLPSASQVVAAVPVGRADPFLPLAGGRAATGGPQQPPALPEGFRFQGVLRSAGTAQALVQFGAESGALRVGDLEEPGAVRLDRGGRITDLLPACWSVAAIDVQQGRLVLKQGQQTVKAEL